MGDHQRALDHYNGAAEIFRGIGDKDREANSLSNMATEYAELGDFQKALDLNLSVLAVRRSLHEKGREAALRKE